MTHVKTTSRKFVNVLLLYTRAGSTVFPCPYPGGGLSINHTITVSSYSPYALVSSPLKLPFTSTVYNHFPGFLLLAFHLFRANLVVIDTIESSRSLFLSSFFRLHKRVQGFASPYVQQVSLSVTGRKWCANAFVATAPRRLWDCIRGIWPIDFTPAFRLS